MSRTSPTHPLYQKHGGCDPAEFLTAIAAIKAGDPDMWSEAWKHAAKTAEKLVEAAPANNDRVATREALLRADSYTRASGYMFINGPTFETHHLQALPIARKVQALFKRALSLLACDARFFEIPYEDGQAPEIMLPGYLFLPSSKDRLEGGSLPILINVGGADSSQEEMYFIHP